MKYNITSCDAMVTVSPNIKTFSLEVLLTMRTIKLNTPIQILRCIKYPMSVITNHASLHVLVSWYMPPDCSFASRTTLYIGQHAAQIFCDVHQIGVSDVFTQMTKFFLAYQTGVSAVFTHLRSVFLTYQCIQDRVIPM